MKVFTPIVLLAMTYLILPQTLFSQCSTIPCPPGAPMWDQDPTLACIANSEFELDCFNGTMPSGGVVNAGPPTWCTTVENNIFFAFTATSSTASFDIAVGTCSSGNGLQAAILSTPDCNTFDFVSACVGNINQGSSAIITSTTPLNPGEVYYLMIDGQAGAVCDFSINGGLPSEPTGQQVCIGANPIGIYNNTALANWTIIPPSAGTFIGPNTNVSIVSIQWTTPGTYEVCAQTCPNAPAECVTVTIGQVANVTVGPLIICEGETVDCGGSTYSSSGTFVNTLLGPDGCDSIVTCIVQAIPPINMPPQFVAICDLEEYEICGVPFSSTGSFSETCTSFLGCDSIVNLELKILAPTVFIEPPVETGCGANWSAILSAANSNWIDPPAQHTILWTGPGIVGDDDQPVITIDAPGTYCFSVSHELYGTTCEAEDCIEVEQGLLPVDPPDVDGPTSVCGGFEEYVASPTGDGIPDGFSWTTPNGEPFTVVNFFTISVDWNGSIGGELCVTAFNACGPSDPTCITISVGTGPETPILDGPTEVCEGSSQTYELTNPTAGATCTWTVPPGASFSQTDTTIVVDFDGATSGDVCITCMDLCGTTPEVCIAVVVNTPPDAPTFSSGPNQVCASETANYCVDPVTGADSYSWTTPAGNFPDTTNCLDIDWTGFNSGDICVTANNECGSSPETCFNVQIIDSPTAVLSGDGAVCAGSGDTIEMSIILTGTPSWTVTYTIDNVLQTPITGIQTSPYTLFATGIGSYALNSITDGGICLGTVSGSGSITENDLPTADLSGSGDICDGSGTQVNLTITLTGAAPWQVDYIGGNGTPSTLNINASPFTLPIGQGNAGAVTLISVIDDNDCEGTVSGMGQVNVISAPTVNNVSTLCDPTNTNYTVSFTITGGDPSTYSITPADGTLVDSVFTSNIILSGNGYSFVVTDVNDCNPVTVEDNLVVCDCTTAVGVMDGTTLDTCGIGPITGFIYDDTNQVLDGDDVLMYVFHSGSSVAIVPPIFSITPTPTATFDMATMTYGTTYYMSAVTGNGGGPQGIDLNDPCLAVAQGTPVIFYDIPTATMVGATEICEGETAELTFTLTGVSPWTVIINGQPVSNIFTSPYVHTVEPDMTTTYVLTSVMDVNCDNAATGSEVITVNFAPTVSPAVITCNGSGTAYTVCFEIFGGDPSCYDVAPLDGTLTGNMFCSDEIADGLGYSFVVSDCKGCPPVTIEDPLVDCSCISIAGNMDNAELDVCEDALAEPVYLGGDVLDADDALCFVLHTGNPLMPIASNSTASFSFDATTMTIGTTYFICPVVGNADGSGCVDLSDPCLSIGGCAEVTFREIPTATILPGSDICLGEDASLSVAFTGAGPWTFVYQDDQGNTDTFQASNSPFTFDVTPAVSTDYSLVSMDGKFCTGTVDGLATVSVHEAPEVLDVVADCNPSATEFTVSFEITGGDPTTYNISPSNGMLTGSIFTSNPYLNGETYSFDIDDQFQCGPVELIGAFNCDCLTDAGVMSANVIGFCVDTSAEVGISLNFNLDPDDVLMYYLHTNSDSTLGTVIAISDTPVFDFDPGSMSTGVTYYISAVAGNNDGTNNVDLGDICLDIAPGTPIVFNDLPTLAISGETTICNGESATVTFALTGIGPFSIVFEIDNVQQPPQVIPIPGTFDIPISPTISTSYSLISITDQGTGCMNTASGIVDITVNDPVTAGSPYGDFENCDNNDFTISLFENLVGFEYGGTWTDQSGNVFPNGSLNTADLLPGIHVFTYTVTGTPPCPDDQESVNVIIHPAPVADAGDDITLDCDLTSTSIGGNGTTPGMTYSWEGNVSDSTIAQPTIGEAGEFILTVTSPFNCVDLDTTYAFVSQGIPSPVVTITDVSCFGMADGFIQIDDITGGNPPYTCSFNGGPFTDNKLFQNLSPGPYSIVIEDASGCETTLNFTVTEPEEVTVDLSVNVEGMPPVADYNTPIIIEIITNPPFQDMDTVIWNSTTSTDSLCGNCQFNEVALQFQTTFSVQVVDEGCPADDLLTVFVERDHFVYIPNAFSPNNDGPETNNLFEIYDDNNVALVHSFIIFSRWGETVHEFYNFKLDDPDNDYRWDGKLNEENMNPQVFVWTAEIEFTDGVIKQYKGDVTLMR